MTTTYIKLPRKGSRHSEGLMYGKLAVALNRGAGLFVVAFLIVHVLAESILNIPSLSTIKNATPWLPAAQHLPVVHGVLFAAITFHTLYGYKLIAMDMGARFDFRKSLWIICGISLLVFAREVLRYVGV